MKESFEKLSALQQFISQVKREIEQAVIEELTDLGLKNDEIENAVSSNEWSWRGDADSAVVTHATSYNLALDGAEHLMGKKKLLLEKYGLKKELIEKVVISCYHTTP